LVVEFNEATVLQYGALRLDIVDVSDGDEGPVQINVSTQNNEWDGIWATPDLQGPDWSGGAPSIPPAVFPAQTIKFPVEHILRALVYEAGQRTAHDGVRTWDAYDNPEGINLGLIFQWGVEEIEVTRIYLEGGTKNNPR
jgi:hypothetical protein